MALGVSATAFAQVPVPIEYLRPLKNSVSVGVRVLGGGAKVSFSKLGSIPSPGLPTKEWMDDKNTDGTLKYPNGISYDNGTVSRDAFRAEEQLSATAGVNDVEYYGLGVERRYRYYTVTPRLDPAKIGQVDGDGKPYYVINPATNAPYYDHTSIAPTTDGYVYNNTLSRAWSFNHPSQLSANGLVGLSAYEVTPGSTSLEADDTGGAGFELQFGRVIQRFKKFEWGLNFTFGLSDINAKTRQTIKANLTTVTDYYQLLTPADAATLVAPYIGPAFPAEAQRDGSLQQDRSLLYNYETTSRIYQRPVSRSTPPMAINGADIEGYWQIKGAYYMFRFGPNARIPISRRFTLNVGAGVAAAYAGTRFIAEERLTRDDVSLFVTDENQLSKMVTGVYGDLTAEWWLTARTGFYGGASYEALGKLERTLSGRTAKVELGKGAVLRFGVITRF